MLDFIFNFTGIFLLMTGLWLIYFNGISPRLKKGIGTGFYSTEKIASTTKEGIEKEKKFKKRADLGLALSLAGMVAQLIALFF